MHLVGDGRLGSAKLDVKLRDGLAGALQCPDAVGTPKIRNACLGAAMLSALIVMK